MIKRLNDYTYLMKGPLAKILNEFSYGGKIFIKENTQEYIRIHEEGHWCQWYKYGGFIYTFKVAIPSVFYNIYDRLILRFIYDVKTRSEKYYSKPWEKEATELGCKMNGKPID